MAKSFRTQSTSAPFFCGLGLIQFLVLLICLGQTILLLYLYNNHSIFFHSSSNASTSLILKNVKSGISDGDNLPSAVTRVDLQYNPFPVKVTTIDSTDHVPKSSAESIKSLLGSIVAVDFPDLKYRSSNEIHEKYPLIFSELPSDRFSPFYKNPCWKTEESSEVSTALNCLPYAYVLGQPKCGTSDLYERLRKHQNIIAPQRKEVRWFSRGEFMTEKMRHEGDIDESGEEVHSSGPIGEALLGKGSSVYSFTKYFSALSKELISRPDDRQRLFSFDGGPHTFWWPTQSPDGGFETEDVPAQQLIREIQPQAKMILTLADPVRRMHSDYYFLEDNLRPVRPGGATTKSAREFHERVVFQISTFNVCIDSYISLLTPQIINAGIHLEQSKYHKTIEAYLNKEHSENFALWFRAAQMCAHDRYNFGYGGYGRITIGLYVLFLEKWLEEFPLENFLILRLEDYEENPQEYMKYIFTFLDAGEPNDWSEILNERRANRHKVHKEPLLEETEKLLRDFYRPYNELLAKLLNDDKFLWNLKIVDGKAVSLRMEEMKESESEQKQGSVGLKKGSRRLPGSPGSDQVQGVAVGNGNQHGSERMTREEIPHLESNKPGHLRGDVSNAPVSFKPQSFSLDNLPMPTTQYDSSLHPEVKSVSEAGKQLCEAAFTMDVARLKYLLYDLGIPPNSVHIADAHRNAFHCIATLYSMGEAHSKSHVFAELKGLETWLTPHLKPSLELKLNSVLARDITDHLAEDINAALAWLVRAGVPANVQDAGGHSPLHIAAAGGELVIVKALIDIGADLNQLNNENRTPLHVAAGLGHAEVAGLLISAGASFSIKDKNGVSAWDIIVNPGPIMPEDSLKYMNITQRPTRQIERRIHPGSSPEDTRLGWKGGSGSWGEERLKGFEEDVDCSAVDQYFASEISGDEIFKNYLAHNAPVLIRGLLDDWPAIDMYSVDNLKSKFGELTVTVSDIPYANKFGGSTPIDMKLGEYIDQMRSHKLKGGAHPWYVFKGHPIPHSSDDPDSLVPLDACPIPGSISDAFKHATQVSMRPKVGASMDELRKMFVNAQWALGGEGTGAPIHFHNGAWNALIYGAKKWIIYPPHNMIMSNKQILDFYETDRLEFEARGIRPVTCVQMAGDLMIIPESWGHGVMNIQESVAVATEFKESIWRIRPNPQTAMHISSFDNRQLYKPPDNHTRGKGKAQPRGRRKVSSHS